MTDSMNGLPRALEFREATPDDAHALAALRYEFRGVRAGVVEDGGEFIARCAEWMRDRLNAPDRWRCWVVTQDTQIIGHLWLQRIEKIPNPAEEPEEHAYITNFFVRASQRGAGVGSRLLALVLEWCREQQMDAVILWPTQESRSLYLRNGFTTPARLLELALAEHA